jgi:hypothetical protein
VLRLPHAPTPTTVVPTTAGCRFVAEGSGSLKITHSVLAV